MLKCGVTGKLCCWWLDPVCVKGRFSVEYQEGKCPGHELVNWNCTFLAALTTDEATSARLHLRSLLMQEPREGVWEVEGNVVSSFEIEVVIAQIERELRDRGIEPEIRERPHSHSQRGTHPAGVEYEEV